MKFKIDENLPIDLAFLLKEAGYDATTVFEENLKGKSDALVLSSCRKEKRILITFDRGFADIYTYPPHKFPGFIVFRLRRQDKLYVLNIFREVISLFSKESPYNRLWIVDESGIRIRSGKLD